MRTIRKASYSLQLDSENNIQVFNTEGDLPFVQINGVPMLPHANRFAEWKTERVFVDEAGADPEIIFELAPNSLYDNPRVVLRLRDEYVEMFFKGTVKRRIALNRWYLLPEDSVIEAIDVVNFRCHLESPMAYEVGQTLLSRRRLGAHGLQETTDDSDLMFGPHPMMFLFRHLEDHCIIGPMELVQGDCVKMQMKKSTNTIASYHIHVGDNLYWLEEGEELESPHFMIVQNRSEDIYKTVEKYTGLLVRDGFSVPKKEEDMEPWWRLPMWCSWGDQHTYWQHLVYATDPGSSDKLRQSTLKRITPEMIEEVVEVITKYDLPVRTLILDDRWYTRYGDMDADPERFSNLREMVDSLHARGFKVLCWASLFRFVTESWVVKDHPEWFLIHHYRNEKINDEYHVTIDYSMPEAIEGFLNPLLTKLLSDQEGCYNFDGIKFDWPYFVPADYPYENRDWIGKETAEYKTFKTIYDESKKVKHDALIIGISPHPFFQDTQDITRTYDVTTYDPTIHLERAKYIKAICPGMTPAIDEHIFFRNFFRLMRESTAEGHIPMLYNLLHFQGDAHEYTDDEYRELSTILKEYVEHSPELNRYFNNLPKLSATTQTERSCLQEEKSVQSALLCRECE